ncbi:hypothetical protein AB0L20_31805, partial [Streptomyces albidoflavus]|uniref:hypothetical protein n=1 Tax=Streptomyces albidoflavus TaxID=1886 RepID=UPI0034780E80
GHSTWQKGVDLCRAADVKSLAIIHLYPGHDDVYLRAAEKDMQTVMPEAFVARERQSVTFAPADKGKPKGAKSAADPKKATVSTDFAT